MKIVVAVIKTMMMYRIGSRQLMRPKNSLQLTLIQEDMEKFLENPERREWFKERIKRVEQEDFWNWTA